MNTIISLEIYPFDIMFSFNESDKKLFKKLKKLKIPKKEIKNCKLESNGLYLRFSNNTSLIRLPWIPKSPYEISILTHEVLHAVVSIFRVIDLPLSYKSEEAYTYLLDFIINKILTYVNK